MKRCCQCKVEKHFSCFAIRNKSTGSLQSMCKECRREYDRERYSNSDGKEKERLRKKRLALMERNRNYVTGVLKNSPCVDCGESDPVVLHFDHTDQSTKKFNVSNMVYGGYSLETIQAEIEKCEVRCANCHTRRTAKQFGWFALTEH